MRASPIAPAVPFIVHKRDEKRARPVALSRPTSTPRPDDVIERDSPVAV
jgi:hypothetical protein